MKQKKNPKIDEDEYIKEVEALMKLTDTINHKNVDELHLFDIYRSHIMYMVEKSRKLKPENENFANRLKELMIDMKVGPSMKFQSESAQKYAENLFYKKMK